MLVPGGLFFVETRTDPTDTPIHPELYYCPWRETLFTSQEIYLLALGDVSVKTRGERTRPVVSGGTRGTPRWRRGGGTPR